MNPRLLAASLAARRGQTDNNKTRREAQAVIQALGGVIGITVLLLLVCGLVARLTLGE